MACAITISFYATYLLYAWRADNFNREYLSSVKIYLILYVISCVAICWQTLLSFSYQLIEISGLEIHNIAYCQKKSLYRWGLPNHKMLLWYFLYFISICAGCIFEWNNKVIQGGTYVKFQSLIIYIKIRIGNCIAVIRVPRVLIDLNTLQK